MLSPLNARLSITGYAFQKHMSRVYVVEPNTTGCKTSSFAAALISVPKCLLDPHPGSAPIPCVVTAHVTPASTSAASVAPPVAAFVIVTTALLTVDVKSASASIAVFAAEASVAADAPVAPATSMPLSYPLGA